MRGDGSILDAIKQPDLAAEITLQPVRRYGVDAAVLYSDIVVPAHAVGFGIDVAPGTGPVAPDPLRRRGRPRPAAPARARRHRATSPRPSPLVAAELGPDVPVLAFAGAPFTVASYLIEGGPSRTYEHTKALLHTDEALWHDVMDRLAAMAVAFIDVQLASGAQAFQLFDSWAGTLSRADYERYVLPHSRRVFAELAERHPGVPGHPLRHRVRPPPRGDARRPGRRSWASTGARRSPPRGARLGADLVVQGNLDPALVLAGADVALAGARAVLADNAGHPGHVFNLGHGVHPTTDPGVLAAVVDLVHTRRR